MNRRPMALDNVEHLNGIERFEAKERCTDSEAARDRHTEGGRMKHRDYGGNTIFGSDLQSRKDGSTVGHDGLMSKNRSLRKPRSARCVDDRRVVFAFDGRKDGARCGSLRDEIIEAETFFRAPTNHDLATKILTLLRRLSNQVEILVGPEGWREKYLSLCG